MWYLTALEGKEQEEDLTILSALLEQKHATVVLRWSSYLTSKQATYRYVVVMARRQHNDKKKAVSMSPTELCSVSQRRQICYALTVSRKLTDYECVHS